MKKLYRRLLDICYENKLHHLGSYFSCLHIIDDIYKNKGKDDIFILSNGHAVVALYVFAFQLVVLLLILIDMFIV